MSENKLSVKGLAITSGILWSGSVFVVGLINLIVPTYGLTFLWFVSSVYPGYKAEPTLISVLIGTGYAVLDGALSAMFFAWLYNFFLGFGKK